MEVRARITEDDVKPYRELPRLVTVYNWFPSSMVTDKKVLVGRYEGAQRAEALLHRDKSIEAKATSNAPG